MGAAQGVAIWLSNKLYTLLTVAFIEMARAMLPLITLAALWLASLETPTLEHIKAVSLTGVGCAISAYGE
ncbi:TPT domain-containing protein, partial [Haematococcus lacustris]